MLSDRCLFCPVLSHLSVLPVMLVYSGQTVGWIEMKLGMEIGLGTGHIDPAAPPPKGPKGHSPQFSAHICCGQTAGWIKMPLGIEVGLGAGHNVLDGDPAPPQKKTAQPPNFRSMFVVAKGLDGSRCHLVRR